jgi:putative transposase
MPDHVHLFCAPVGDAPGGVVRWVAYWKRLASIALSDLGDIWQRDCWDTQLRQARRYEEKWVYVLENPVRKGLVKRWEDWPHQGCLNDLWL